MPDPDTSHPPLPSEIGYRPGDDADWDAVDQASWESFPASDPPAWNHHRVIGTPDDRAIPAHADHALARRRRRTRLAAAFGLFVGGLILTLVGRRVRSATVGAPTG